MDQRGKKSPKVTHFVWNSKLHLGTSVILEQKLEVSNCVPWSLFNSFLSTYITFKQHQKSQRLALKKKTAIVATSLVFKNKTKKICFCSYLLGFKKNLLL